MLNQYTYQELSLSLNPVVNSVRATYPSDLSEREWNQLAGLLQRFTSQRGRPAIHSRRLIVNAIRYLVRTGAPWRYLPADFPPWQTVYYHFTRWVRTGILHAIHTHLRQQLRLLTGRNPTPTAAIIDSQSVRAADTVSISRGWDQAKKVNGRKRHLAVDTQGFVLSCYASAANAADSTAARLLLLKTDREAPHLRLVWADAAYYSRPLRKWASQHLNAHIEAVHKRPGQTTFIPLPRRWVVERTLAWISKHRRCVRDYEGLPAHHAAMVYIASTTWMLKRITNQ